MYKHKVFIYNKLQNRILKPLLANPTAFVDLLGLVIATSCPIDSYFQSLRIHNYAVTVSNGEYNYSYTGAPDPASGIGNEKLIVVRMIQTKYVFRPTRPDQLANLKKHVGGRITIVNNAFAKKFVFPPNGAPEVQRHTISPPPDLLTDPQKYFDSINNSQTQIRCKVATTIVFESGNRWSGLLNRPRDGIFIPGDYPYISNTAYDNSWPSGTQGENMISMGEVSGVPMFWGHSGPGNTVQSEKDWFDDIKKWTSNDGTKNGNPKWDDTIKEPKIGLQ